MNRKFVMLFLLMITAVTLALLVNARQTAASAWTQKVDQWVLDNTANGNETEFLVFLKEQADLSGAAALPTKDEKGQYVYEQLTAVANRTQPAVTAVLDGLEVEYRPFWVANMIWVKGDSAVVQTMAQHNSVAHIYANPTVQMEPMPPLDETELIEQALTVEWNIALVNANDVWAAGYTGQGAVIGAQDTGYDWDHPALINKYRGWNGSSANHNYNWHDAIHSGGGICGANSPQPCDDNGHGTHTAGTMVGDDGGTNQIGMAPGAKWIGCRNMDQGNGTPATYSECYQWFIAPTDLNNNNPDPSMAPHVIGNSWGCPASEGCTDPNVLLTVVQNVRAAGIVTVHSAGNSGSSCSTVNTPAGIYDESYSVGATTSGDTIASFSSRGPVTVDGSNRPKPDISAPGVGVRSSLPNGAYGSLSGTSMASPHVTGLVALLVSIDPSLAGQVDTLETIISQTAVPRFMAACGNDGDDRPNNTYGWGRIDALAAYNGIPLNLSVQKTAAEAVAPGNLLTYTLTVQNVQPISTTHNVIVTDTLPANTTFVTASTPYTLTGSTIEWYVGDLTGHETADLTLVVQVAESATGEIVNDSYGATSQEVAPVNGSPVSTTVVPFALGLDKTASAESVYSGELLTYTLTVTNLSTLAATSNVMLTDTIPANTTFVAATGSYTVTGDVVMWHSDSLAANSSWVVELVVQVTLAKGVVSNEAYGVESDQVSAVSGEPVNTIVTIPPVIEWNLYLPVIVKP